MTKGYFAQIFIETFNLKRTKCLYGVKISLHLQDQHTNIFTQSHTTTKDKILALKKTP